MIKSSLYEVFTVWDDQAGPDRWPGLSEESRRDLMELSERLLKDHTVVLHKDSVESMIQYGARVGVSRTSTLEAMRHIQELYEKQEG